MYTCVRRGGVRFRMLIVAAAMLCALSAPAQRPTAMPDSLLRMPVVVGRRPLAPAAAAMPVQRMDTAALRRRGATDIGAALRRFAGVNLRDYGGAGGLKTVSVRGFGAAHTAVCYDGMPTTDTRGGATDLSAFSSDRLQSMTLAVGGTQDLLAPVRTLVATTTLDIAPLRPSDDAVWHGAAALNVGSFGTISPALSLSLPLGRQTALGVGGDFFYARNDYPFELHNGNTVTRERRSGSRMQRHTADIGLRHATKAGGTWHTALRTAGSHRRLPGQVVLYADNNDERLREQCTTAQTLWRQRFGRLALMAGGKIDFRNERYADYDAQYPDGVLCQNYRQRESYATVGAAYSLKALALSYALDATHATLRSNQPTDGHVRRNALQQALSLRCETRHWEFTARLFGHVVRDRRSGGTASQGVRRLTPSVSLAWLAVQRKSPTGGTECDWRWRIFAKESFRMPSFTECYYYHLGSTELRPERARQTGVGTTLRLSRPGTWLAAVALTADAYLNRVNDCLQAVPRNLYVWQMMNVGRVAAEGVDITLDACVRPARRHALFASANYSWQHVCDRTMPGGGSYNRQLAYTPRHSGTASVAWENAWVGLAAHVVAVAERWTTNTHVPEGTRLPRYAEWGFGAYRSFRAGGLSFDVRADLANAFGTQYEVIRRYPMPQRHVKLTLAAKW